MPVITVIHRVNEEPVREKMERELHWYDTIKKEIQIFHGGKLTFVYKKDDYLVKMGESERNKRGIRSTFRLLPKVEDLEVVNYKKVKADSNQGAVDKWFDSYSNYNSSEAVMEVGDEYGTEFNVPEKEMEDFCDQLDRQGFRYE